MKLNLPSIVDNHNDLPGVVNDAQVTGGDAAVHEAGSIANNVGQQLSNAAALAIIQASTNNAPNDPNAKNAPKAESVSAVPTNPNIVPAPSNVVRNPLIDLPVPPNPPEYASPLVGVPPSNASTAPTAPTEEESPSNVLLKRSRL